jgi:hypothetical protein
MVPTSSSPSYFTGCFLSFAGIKYNEGNSCVVLCCVELQDEECQLPTTYQQNVRNINQNITLVKY